MNMSTFCKTSPVLVTILLLWVLAQRDQGTDASHDVNSEVVTPVPCLSNVFQVVRVWPNCVEGGEEKRDCRSQLRLKDG